MASRWAARGVRIEQALHKRARHTWRDHPAPWAIGALLLLVAAVRFLGSATDGLAPWVAGWLPGIADGAPSAVGAAWLSSYVVMNGSLVAAVAVSFHHHGLVTPLGLLLLVAGARLGASGIIVVVGALSSLRRTRQPLHEAARLGMLSSIVTLTVYAPIAIVAALMAETLPGAGASITAPIESAGAFTWWGAASIVAALLLLWFSLWLLDGAVARMDQQWFKRRWASHLGRPWLGFAVGFGVTVASASVAVSIGALVPLFNRGVLTRREAIPYILGANVGTLSDTLLIALALGSYGSLVTLLVLGGAAAIVSVTFLALYRWHSRSVAWLQDRVMASPWSFWSAIGVFVAVPLVLIAL